ncbi:MAG TPA: hypothetical protein VFV67_13290 [Actinophytocola sp.]|uniref:hypothetical protein n=1 Tax=Actinophytocola sp. TaxID=1872138 RepID=UPI002DB62F7B|nr:hypothetical protein [Actinophytocola sp.]HEU5471622.1 hypothetical protein [Actinophytocola sp.]
MTDLMHRTPPTVRDTAATALVLGLASAAWAGWGLAQPPDGWSLPLIVGSMLGVLVAAVAGIRTWTYRAGASAMHDPAGRRRYVRIVGVEVGLIVLGVLVLEFAGRSDYLAPWTLFVVGAHLLPLGGLFRVAGLRIAGVLLALVAVAAGLSGMLGGPAPSAVSGAGGALVMIVAGAVELGRSWTIAA